MKKFLIAAAIVLASCSKYDAPVPTCKRVYYLSDKYDADTNYIRTDTLWPFGRFGNDFCSGDTLKFSNQSDLWFLCDDSTYELRRWVIGNVITQPNLFK